MLTGGRSAGGTLSSPITSAVGLCLARIESRYGISMPYRTSLRPLS